MWLLDVAPPEMTANVVIPFPIDPGLFVPIITIMIAFLLLKLFKRLLGDAVFIVALLLGAGIFLAIRHVVEMLGH